jgi:membrane protein implicated in regulation of membrane protease activity
MAAAPDADGSMLTCRVGATGSCLVMEQLQQDRQQVKADDPSWEVEQSSAGSQVKVSKDTRRR